MSEGIMPGGCLPPDNRDFPKLPNEWPDKCWPPYPPPPEPDPGEDGPGSLSTDVDWMTYSHPELHSMVSGMDLTGAMSVSAGWAKLGDELAEIGEELRLLLEQTAAAWQGPAADLAKGSVSALAEWSAQTGVGATEVSGAISREVDAANTARNTMPSPFMTELPDRPTGPHEVLPATAPQSASPFTGADFTSAQSVIADPGPGPVGRAGHEQAARVMATFQAETNEIYGTVPQFAKPNLSRRPPATPNPPSQPQPPQQQPTGPAQQGPGGGAVVGGGGGSYGGGSAGGAPGGQTTPRPGAGVSAAPEGAPRPGAAPAAASAGAKPGGGMPMGGMPMGGMGGSRGGEDGERKSKSYLEEDEDLWGLGENRPVPPVIGEDRRRA